MDPRAQIGQLDAEDIRFMVGRVEDILSRFDEFQRYTDFSSKLNRYALLWWELNRISALASAIEDDWILWWEADRQLLHSLDATLVEYQRHVELNGTTSTAMAQNLGQIRGDIHRLEALVGWLAEAQIQAQAPRIAHYRVLVADHLAQILRRLPRWIETLIEAHHLLDEDNRTKNKEATPHD